MTIRAPYRLLRRRAPTPELPRIAAWSLAAYPFNLRVGPDACPSRVAERAGPQTEVEDKRECGRWAGDPAGVGIRQPRSPLTFAPSPAPVRRYTMGSVSDPGWVAYPCCWRSRRTAIRSSYLIEQTPTSGCICSSKPTTGARDPAGSAFACGSGCARPPERRAVGARPFQEAARDRRSLLLRPGR
jgi:hypothetical protein